MKKHLLFFFLSISVSSIIYAQWTKVDLTKNTGGSITPNIYQLGVKNSKLYAATSDGIFESQSGNGGDWQNFGLQGKKVYLLNFDILQLALTIETAADDATKKTLQLYKYNGSTWENTGFNPDKLKIFGDYPENLTNFAQVQNGTEVTVAVPTWGNGIWISHNSGQTWAQVPYENHPSNNYHFYRKIPGVFSFPDSNVIYALDKADFGLQYLSISEDLGQTWSHKEVDNFFNPWALYKRSLQGINYLYYGGENGEKGFIYRSSDGGNSWDASFTLGNGGLHNRRMISDESGKLYLMAGTGDVYVSDDNGDTFIPYGTGIIKPQVNNKFFLTHLIKKDTKLFVSTDNDGIYSINLNATGVSNTSINNDLFNYDQVESRLIINESTGSRVSIFNVSGVLLKQSIASTETTTIDVKQLPKAIYILSVISASGNQQIKRFIVQ